MARQLRARGWPVDRPVHREAHWQQHDVGHALAGVNAGWARRNRRGPFCISDMQPTYRKPTWKMKRNGSEVHRALSAARRKSTEKYRPKQISRYGTSPRQARYFAVDHVSLRSRGPNFGVRTNSL